MTVKILIILVIIVAGLQVYVRFAPVDLARFDVNPFDATDPGPSGAKRVLTDLPAPPDTLMAQIRDIALATPRTRLVAEQSNRMTFETRSAFWGFPDYTTIEARQTDTGTELALLARLRFGRSDLGVNGKRIEAWTQQLNALQP